MVPEANGSAEMEVAKRAHIRDALQLLNDTLLLDQPSPGSLLASRGPKTVVWASQASLITLSLVLQAPEYSMLGRQGGRQERRKILAGLEGLYMTLQICVLIQPLTLAI